MRSIPKSKAKVKVGQVVERLTVLGLPFYMRLGKQTHAFVVCECTCGAIVVKAQCHVASGHTRSCGCFGRDMATVRAIVHGGYGTRLHNTWHNMLRRCSNERGQDWHNYGGRGIAVCEEWKLFSAFRDWAMSSGYANNLTIERRSNDLGYNPTNCHWVPKSKQAKNQRRNIRVTAFGETKILTDWVRDPRCVVTREGLRKRLADMSPEDAITLPVRHNNKWTKAKEQAGGAS